MKSSAAILLALVALLVLSNGLFVVREDQQVIITQFGEPQGDPITEPGMKFKLPFIQRPRSSTAASSSGRATPKS